MSVDESTKEIAESSQNSLKPLGIVPELDWTPKPRELNPDEPDKMESVTEERSLESVAGWTGDECILGELDDPHTRS